MAGTGSDNSERTRPHLDQAPGRRWFAVGSWFALLVVGIAVWQAACKPKVKLEERETRYSNGQLKSLYTVAKDPQGNYLRQGKMTNWDEKGNKQFEGYYVDDKMDGTSHGWYENGQLMVEVHHNHGQTEGKFTGWFDNGKKRNEGEVVRNGRKHGKWSEWYDNGQLQSEGEFIDDKLQGKLTIWHKNGQKMEEGFFSQNKRVGNFTYWNENGEEIGEVEGEKQRKDLQVSPFGLDP